MVLRAPVVKEPKDHQPRPCHVNTKCWLGGRGPPAPNLTLVFHDKEVVGWGWEARAPDQEASVRLNHWILDTMLWRYCIILFARLVTNLFKDIIIRANTIN